MNGLRGLLSFMDIFLRLLLRIIPNRLYEMLRKLFGRGKKYHTREQYISIARSYLKELGTKCFVGSCVMEIGSGNQIETASCLLENGAKQVIVVDPIINPRLSQSGSLVVVEASCFNEEIAHRYARSIDVLVSYQVLEHVRDVPLFMRCVAEVLTPNGIFFARVDVSDHIYHGIKPLMSVLNVPTEVIRCKYLEYSDSFYRRIHPHKRVYMNRCVLPEILQAMDDAGLKWQLQGEYLTHNNVIHPDIVKRVSAKYSQYTQAYWFALRGSRDEAPPA
jgi:SAM-dependent methyltransferase